MVPGDK